MKKMIVFVSAALMVAGAILYMFDTVENAVDHLSDDDDDDYSSNEQADEDDEDTDMDDADDDTQAGGSVQPGTQNQGNYTRETTTGNVD